MAPARCHGGREIAYPSPLAGPLGRGRGPLRSNGKVRGNSPRGGDLDIASSPLTLPMLRMGPLPPERLSKGPQGERDLWLAANTPLRHIPAVSPLSEPLPAIAVEGLTKRFKAVTAVDAIDLAVPAGGCAPPLA